MKGEIELYNISFLILKVELHFKPNFDWSRDISGSHFQPLISLNQSEANYN